MIHLRTENNLFMSYEFKSLFGLIRISKEAIYIFSLYNTNIGDGSFKEFMEYVESSKKPVVILNVINPKLWHHFRVNGYHLFDGKIKGTELSFRDSLIKHP